MTAKSIRRGLLAALLGAGVTLSVTAQTPQGPPPATPPSGGGPAAARSGAPGPAAGRGGIPPAPPLTAAAMDRAQPILTEARKALGGDKLAALTSIIANGQTRRVRGDNLVPIEFEIDIELPDKYVRKDEVPAEESQPTSNGFVGNDIIQIAAPAGRGRGGPGPGGPPPGGGRGPAAPPTPEQLEAQKAARLIAIKQDFARLMLGVTAGTLDTYPMQFGYAAQAAAPQGTADVIDVRGAGNFAARLFIDSQTRLPIMLTWQTPGPSGPAEARLFYADYRDVNGIKLPFRLRRANGADTTEETTFDRFRLNTKIDPKKFAVPK